MKISELVEIAYKHTLEKDLWRYAQTPLEMHSLIHMELSEASLEVKDKNPAVYHYDLAGGCAGIIVEGFSDDPKVKPEGEAVELADVVLMIASYFGKNGWDFEEVLKRKIKYNKTRPIGH